MVSDSVWPHRRQPTRLPVPGILQARTLEWVALSFSNAWKWKVKVKSLSRVWLFATPWTAPHQAPLSMGFSRQEYWSGVPLPSLKKKKKKKLKIKTPWQIARHSLVKLLYFKKKWFFFSPKSRNLLSHLAKKKQQLLWKRKIRLSSDFLTTVVYDRRNWSNIFKILKERKYNPRGLCPENLTFM